MLTQVFVHQRTGLLQFCTPHVSEALHEAYRQGVEHADSYLLGGYAQASPQP